MTLQQTKYIVVTKHRILTHGGFILKSKFNNHTIKLFDNTEAARLFIENHRHFSKVKYDVKKIKVTYEMELDEE